MKSKKPSRFSSCFCFSSGAESPSRRATKEGSGVSAGPLGASTGTIASVKTTTVDLEPSFRDRQCSWTSADFFDCLSEMDTTVETVETPVKRQTFGSEIDLILESALFAQKSVLSHWAEDGSKLFKPTGKSGAVRMAVKPGSDHEFQVVRGTVSFGINEVTVEDTIEFLMDASKRSTFDNQCHTGRVDRRGLIDEPGHRRLDLCYCAYKGMMGVAGRDCVFSMMYEKLEDNFWVLSSKSIIHEEYPEGGVLPGFVRCDVVTAGYVLRIDPGTGELLLEMFNQVDVGGNLPTWIVNKAQMKQPAVLNDVFKLLKKQRSG